MNILLSNCRHRGLDVFLYFPHFFAFSFLFVNVNSLGLMFVSALLIHFIHVSFLSSILLSAGSASFLAIFSIFKWICMSQRGTTINFSGNWMTILPRNVMQNRIIEWNSVSLRAIKNSKEKWENHTRNEKHFFYLSFLIYKQWINHVKC